MGIPGRAFRRLGAHRSGRRRPTNLGGFSVWTLTVPANSCLVGATFFQQAFVLDRSANPLGAVMSNAGEATIGAK